MSSHFVTSSTRSRFVAAAFAGMVLVAALVAGIGVQPRQAAAAVFGVNTTADTADVNPGNGVCADAGGQCSLRAAVMEANANGVVDTITLPAGN